MGTVDYLRSILLVCENNRRTDERLPGVRACVSIIIRTIPHVPLQEVLRAKQGNKMACNIQILFIKRAQRITDKWSGHVAFPGGRCTEDESSYYTAVRETKEEVGLDLNSDAFYYCGYMGSGEPVKSRSESFRVGVFVFYQCSHETPPITMKLDEVSSVRWISLNTIAKPPSEIRQSVTFPAHLVKFSAFYKLLLRIFGVTNLYFPGVLLPPTYDVNDNAEHEYLLWGLTYNCTQKLVSSASKSSFSKLHFSTNSFVTNSILTLHNYSAQIICKL